VLLLAFSLLRVPLVKTRDLRATGVVSGGGGLEAVLFRCCRVLLFKLFVFDSFEPNYPDYYFKLYATI